MSIMTKRVLAAILALSAIFVGGWAAAAPRSFYRDLPRHLSMFPTLCSLPC